MSGVEAFIERWSHLEGGAERANYALFLTELCDVIDVPRPDPASATTGAFTADARREAVRDGATAIDLVDGEALCELLKELRIGVTVRMVEEVTVDETAFAEL